MSAGKSWTRFSKTFQLSKLVISGDAMVQSFLSNLKSLDLNDISHSVYRLKQVTRNSVCRLRELTELKLDFAADAFGSVVLQSGWTSHPRQ
jgi:hypothetical protein